MIYSITEGPGKELPKPSVQVSPYHTIVGICRFVYHKRISPAKDPSG